MEFRYQQQEQRNNREQMHEDGYEEYVMDVVNGDASLYGTERHCGRSS